MSGEESNWAEHYSGGTSGEEVSKGESSSANREGGKGRKD